MTNTLMWKHRLLNDQLPSQEIKNYIRDILSILQKEITMDRPSVSEISKYSRQITEFIRHLTNLKYCLKANKCFSMKLNDPDEDEKLYKEDFIDILNSFINRYMLPNGVEKTTKPTPIKYRYNFVNIEKELPKKSGNYFCNSNCGFDILYFSLKDKKFYHQISVGDSKSYLLEPDAEILNCLYWHRENKKIIKK